jgi:catechol-2,3-dioxygenase
MNIIELELLSDDLSGTEKFYKKTLGLTAFSSGKESLYFQIGYTRLIFRKSDNLKPVYHFAIDVPGNRFFDSHNFVKQHTPILPVGPGNDIANFTNWDAKSFYFKDNNGNILEFITRYPNKAYFEPAFSSKCYISVSEIGLVTNNVTELADTLVKEFGIPIYHRQPRGNAFTVAGDDEGLLILSSKGRDWYPVQVKSQSFRTRVLFLDNGNISHIVR